MSAELPEPFNSHLWIALPSDAAPVSCNQVFNEFSDSGMQSIHCDELECPPDLPQSRVANFVEIEAMKWARWNTWGFGVAMLRIPSGWRAAGASHSPGKCSLTSDEFPHDTSPTKIVITLIQRLHGVAPPGDWTIETATEPAFDLGPLWASPPGKTALRLAYPVESPAILSGSFSPLHDGHRKFAAAAAEFLDQPVVYELSASNADKPELDLITLNRRAAQFRDDLLYVTNAPRFDNKAAIFPGSTFLVGWDTAVRVLDRRFSLGGKIESTLDSIARNGCRFLVAARSHDGVLKTLRDLDVPKRFRRLFLELPPDRFFEDISSTEIRNRWWRGEIECTGF